MITAEGTTGQPPQETSMSLFQDLCVTGKPSLREKSATAIAQSLPALHLLVLTAAALNTATSGSAQL